MNTWNKAALYIGKQRALEEAPTKIREQISQNKWCFRESKDISPDESVLGVETFSLGADKCPFN